MKTIKIFLASSEELIDDRNAFGNLVRRLDKIYEKRGIRIELFEWEDYDAAYNDRRKQDEYNDQIKASDMFLALFHTKAGRFTIEEFDIATEEFKKHASPKVYTYCKDLQEGEQESPELTEFKRRLFEEMGHYWSRYNNRDSMQLHFVMQLQLVETNGMVEKLKLENGTVVLEGMPIAKIDNLQFAADNETYQKMSAELVALPEMIGNVRQQVERYPDDEDLRDDLQQKLNRYNKLKEELAQLQKNLFETAQRIAAMQLEQVSDILRRAIEAFEGGNLERANTLLDEIAQEAEYHIAQLERDHSRLQQDISLVHQDIEAFQLQAKTVMADASIPIDDRINKTAAIYAKADDWAGKSMFPYEKYETLLVDYGRFLLDYAQYDKALSVYHHLISISERLYGMNDAVTSTSYNNIGVVYSRLGDFDKALEFYFKAMAIREKMFGKNLSVTGQTYNNIGNAYDGLGNYDKALEFYYKDLVICENTLGMEHPNTARSYNNIGAVYSHLGNYDMTLEYLSKALAIREKVFGLEHPETAGSYNNIGTTYDNLGNYDKSLIYHYKALAIDEKVFGLQHPSTAISYNNIGYAFYNLKDYKKALEYYYKALAIFEKVLGPKNPNTATSYNNIGLVYNDSDDFVNALECYSKALAIREEILKADHPDTATTYNCIGVVYYNLGDYDKALEFFSKALFIRETKLGLEHPSTKTTQNNIDIVKQIMK